MKLFSILFLSFFILSSCWNELDKSSNLDNTKKEVDKIDVTRKFDIEDVRKEIWDKGLWKDNISAYKELAKYYSNNWEREKAIKIYRDYVEKMPWYDSYNSLAISLREAWYHEEARKYFKILEEENPDDLSVIWSIAYMSFMLGDFTEAEKYYKKFLEIKPEEKNDIRVALRLAHLKLKTQEKEAIEYYEKVISVNNNYLNKQWLVWAYFYNWDFQKSNDLILNIMSQVNIKEIKNIKEPVMAWLYLLNSVALWQSEQVNDVCLNYKINHKSFTEVMIGRECIDYWNKNKNIVSKKEKAKYIKDKYWKNNPLYNF